MCCKFNAVAILPPTTYRRDSLGVHRKAKQLIFPANMCSKPTRTVVTGLATITKPAAGAIKKATTVENFMTHRKEHEAGI
jgi:hypothetical protein